VEFTYEALAFRRATNNMGASDDSSFFLYGVGERPEALTLGSLVLEKYWQPMIARHYTHEQLRSTLSLGATLIKGN
jgi:hypothetical protein